VLPPSWHVPSLVKAPKVGGNWRGRDFLIEERVVASERCQDAEKLGSLSLDQFPSGNGRCECHTQKSHCDKRSRQHGCHSRKVNPNFGYTYLPTDSSARLLAFCPRRLKPTMAADGCQVAFLGHHRLRWNARHPGSTNSKAQAEGAACAVSLKFANEEREPFALRGGFGKPSTSVPILPALTGIRVTT
jgi:hypothetical protein